MKASNENLTGRPDAVLFRQDEEKTFFEKLNEIRENFFNIEQEKDYEKLLLSLSEIKMFTDKFFDNVIVNDDNNDIKNNRLELLKMFCNVFNNFINFLKLEGDIVKQFIFSFDDKKINKIKNKKNLLGGKGANLSEMGKLGLPVPPRLYNYY